MPTTPRGTRAGRGPARALRIGALAVATLTATAARAETEADAAPTPKNVDGMVDGAVDPGADGGGDATTPDPAPPDSSAPPGATGGPGGETTVRSHRRDSGQTTVSSADVRHLPGAFGDPFRAIEALPGVTPLVSGLPYFFIRGAPPNNNGFTVDGIRVPWLFHIGIGQGVIHPGLIDRVDFFPGAAP